MPAVLAGRLLDAASALVAGQAGLHTSGGPRRAAPAVLAVELVAGAARVAALVLAAVLVVAAVAKARRPAETAESFAELGLVAPSALARVVPALELGCAVALVVAPAWGGIAAIALLAGFTAVLVGVVRSGRIVRCNCFGQVAAAPVSRRTLLRNAVLLALAATAVAGG